MSEIVTPAVQPIPAIQCPGWCTDCDEGGSPAVYHHGAKRDLILSRGETGSITGDMSLTLTGSNGDSPYVSLTRDNVLAELTIEEADQLADILRSLAEQARTIGQASAGSVPLA
jgi:hypothetical protein